MTSAHSELLLRTEILKAFETAEEAVKKNERLTLSMPLPAVNQLRYAAHHMIKAGWGHTATEDEAYHLRKALNHCKRARFDALDGIIYSCLDFITAFQNLCRSRLNLQSEYPEYRSDYDQMADIQDRLQGLKKIQDMSDGEIAQMEEIASKVVRFKRKVIRLKIRVEKLESIKGDDESIIAAQQFLIPFAATVLGTLTGVIGLIVTIWPLLPNSTSVRCLLVCIVATLMYLGLKKFYRWSVSHMLSGRQKAALSKYNFKFT